MDDNKLAFENAYTFFIVNCLYTNGLYAKSPTHSGNPMKDLKNHYQNIVTGFGKGGNTVAACLANHGQDVAVIERVP